MAASERRLFFALWPPPAVAERLHEVARLAHGACGGRAMRRDTLHLTLAFLGNLPISRVPDAEAAADAVAASPFALEIDRLACWKHNRIAWAGCATPPAALLDLAGQLAGKLCAADFALEERPFAAHVTLVRNADCAQPLPAMPAPIRWPVTDFALVESRLGPGGSRYDVVRRWPMH